MRESGGNLVNLLDQILEISAAEVDAIAIKRAPAVLVDIIAEEVALFSSRAHQAGVSLIMENGFCDQSRQIEDVRVRQCIANLIANAIDHSGADQITVSCSEATERAIAITVSDNGRGVPAHRSELIFHVFGDKGLEGPYEGQGAGLGLALSRSIAQAMGGDLKLFNNSGPGSIFELRFAAPAV